MQVPVAAQAWVKDVSAIAMGPMNLELLGVAKSTWNLKRCSAVPLNRSTKKFGSPTGGAVAPSRSDGKNENSVVFVKQMAFASVPANMAVRRKAQALAPRNWVGLNRLNDP